MSLLQLTLFRHAKTHPAEGDQDDFDRALMPVGRRDAPRIAEGIAAAGASPVLALVSDARRTRETWELIQPAFGRVEARFLPAYYLAPAETLLGEAERADAASVIIVAHNPGLHDLASRLAPRRNALESRLRAKLPTSGAALFERATLDASWKLAAFLTPKAMDAD